MRRYYQARHSRVKARADAGTIFCQPVTGLTPVVRRSTPIGPPRRLGPHLPLLLLGLFCLALALAFSLHPARAELDISPVLEFRQTGGLTGATYELLIYPDGEVVEAVTLAGQPSQRRFPLGTDVVHQLVDDLTAAGFDDWPERFGPANACCDRLEFTLTLRHDGREKTVHLVEGEPAPEALIETIRTLRGLLAYGQA